MNNDGTKPVAESMHKRTCSICRHEQTEEIEREFLAWASPARIATQYGLGDRATVYRHAHALGLMAKRRLNLRASLERIIERSDEVNVTASAVVAAIRTAGKINASGEWIDRAEQARLNALFERMSPEELEAYGRKGVLPAWFPAPAGSDQDPDLDSPGFEAS